MNSLSDYKLCGYGNHYTTGKFKSINQCHECHLKQRKAYRDANKEKVSEQRRAWRLANKDNKRSESRRRRARLRGSKSEPYSEADVLNIYGTVCYLCSIEIDLNAPRLCGKPGWEQGLHIEHVKSIATGGADILENVRPSHAICNVQKGWKS